MRIIGIDIGGTCIKVAVYENGSLTHFEEITTEAEKGGTYIIQKVIHTIEKILKKETIDRIGISTAGQVNSQNGSIRYANTNIPNYTGLQVKDIIESRFHIPTIVENDVNAAAIGEAKFGAGREFNDFICMTYGTGIGGAIVIERKIYKGYGGCAGEFGAIIVHPEHRHAEEDYFSGCYEKYASTTALVNRAMRYDSNLSTGRAIFERYGDIEVKAIIDSWIEEIIYGISTLVHIFNPSAIILGGGIMEQSYILNKINKQLNFNIMPSFSPLSIKQAELKNKAGILGVCYLAEQLTV